MDISKELAELNQNNDSSLKIISDFSAQIDELKKKRHIISVLALVNKLEEFLETGLLKENNIAWIEFHYGQSLSFIFLDEDQQEIEPYDPERSIACDKFINEVEAIVKDFTHQSQFQASHVSQTLVANEGEAIRLKQGMGPKILYSLLSKELHAVLDYSSLNNDLSVKVIKSRSSKL